MVPVAEMIGASPNSLSIDAAALPRRIGACFDGAQTCITCADRYPAKTPGGIQHRIARCPNPGRHPHDDRPGVDPSRRWWAGHQVCQNTPGHTVDPGLPVSPGAATSIHPRIPNIDLRASSFTAFREGVNLSLGATFGSILCGRNPARFNRPLPGKLTGGKRRKP
jgi:hypothetical protein